MRTHSYFGIGTAILVALSCASADAQIVGGATGSLGAATSGGLRNPGAVASGNGSLSGGLDTAPLQNKASGVAGQASNSAHDTSDNVRGHAESATDSAKTTAASTANSASNKANNVASKARQTQPPKANATSATSSATSLTTSPSTDGARSVDARPAMSVDKSVSSSSPLMDTDSHVSGDAAASKRGVATSTNSSNSTTTKTSR